MIRTATGDDRPVAEFGVIAAILRCGGVVGGVSHVHDDGRIRCEVESDHPRALKADFLLDGAHGANRRLGVRLARAAQSLRGSPRPDAVVHPAGGESCAVEFLDRGRDGERVADVNQFPCAVLVGGSDIDVLVRDVFGLVVVTEVNRGLTDDARHWAVIGVNRDMLAARDGFVRAADGSQPDESIPVDVPNHEPDFVGVAGERHRRRVGRALVDRDRIAVVVGSYVVGEFRDVVGPDALAAGFESGWTRGFEQRVEKRALIPVHVRCSRPALMNYPDGAGGQAQTNKTPARESGGMADKLTVLELHLHAEDNEFTSDMELSSDIGNLLRRRLGLGSGSTGESKTAGPVGTEANLESDTSSRPSVETPTDGGDTVEVDEDEESEERGAVVEIDPDVDEDDEEESGGRSKTRTLLMLVLFVGLALLVRRYLGGDDIEDEFEEL
jgi:hypothetical protein